MLKKIIVLSSSFLIFSGCGEIEFPESIPAPVETAEVEEISPKTLNTNTQETTPQETENSSDSSASEKDYETLSKERDNLSEAIQVSQEELKKCSIEKAELETSIATTQKSSGDIKKFAPILEKYLTETPQKEYPFTVCGGIGKATNQSWYADFAIQLENSGLQFAPLQRALKPTDFGGVCASEEGKVAIFLGSTYKGKQDFHLLKYNIESKKLEESLFLSGSSDIFPTKFGKRNGPIITLIGESGSKTKEYEYYYDSNIVKEK